VTYISLQLFHGGHVFAVFWAAVDTTVEQPDILEDRAVQQRHRDSSVLTAFEGAGRCGWFGTRQERATDLLHSVYVFGVYAG